MMKNKYTAPEVEVIFFESENVIKTSETELPWDDGLNRAVGGTWE